MVAAKGKERMPREACIFQKQSAGVGGEDHSTHQQPQGVVGMEAQVEQAITGVLC
jgi:hypothetical protein